MNKHILFLGTRPSADSDSVPADDGGGVCADCRSVHEHYVLFSLCYSHKDKVDP